MWTANMQKLHKKKNQKLSEDISRGSEARLSFGNRQGIKKKQKCMHEMGAIPCEFIVSRVTIRFPQVSLENCTLLI